MQQGFVMGLGLFPSLFPLNFTWDEIFGSNNLNNNNNNGGANGANNEDSREA
jgi:hypothetical protein